MTADKVAIETHDIMKLLTVSESGCGEDYKGQRDCASQEFVFHQLDKTDYSPVATVEFVIANMRLKYTRAIGSSWEQ